VNRLTPNSLARRDAPWTPAQDAILSDDAQVEATAAIAAWPGYAPTPLRDLPDLAARAGVAAIHYKDEGPRFGLGSFKALGGAYAVARVLLRHVEGALGQPVPMADLASGAHEGLTESLTVCCATDGNHGRSVAWGASRFGCRCVIFIHATVSEGRAQAIARWGAEVRRTAGDYDDSVRAAQAAADAHGWTVVSDTSYPGYMDIPRDVMQGYGLMAKEAFDALPAAPTHIFLQTGVGGMAAAVAAAAKRRWGAARPVIALADPERAACWIESFRAGRPTPADRCDTLQAGLACGEVSALAWAVLRDHADAAVAVTDDEAFDVMRLLARRDPPVVAGESATAGLAALLALGVAERAALGVDARSRVLVFGTEADTDPELYRRIVG
jgi:diaminopropionate ammonia-lyase